MSRKIKEGDKIYLVTRSDLAPGYQAVQSCHALRQFVEEHPEIDSSWFKESNYLALLCVTDETELVRLCVHAEQKGHKFSVFREPDIGNQVTAIALEPGAKKLCRKLDLALQ